uniref:Uncharacterized protein n=1 Tax=Glossina palpalis gambiensis TaxID=67801 RepID=A0A1B0BX29_9MUSC
MLHKVIVAVQLAFKISKHTAPVTEDTFGCHILVTKRTLGALKGYLSGTLISSANFPPSYGVPGGPAISAQFSHNI